MSRDVQRLDKPPAKVPKKPRWPRRVSAKKQAELERGELDRACQIVAKRSRGQCEIQWTTNVCTVRATEFHHRLPRSAGGPHYPENLLHCCKFCHRATHENPMQAYARRVLLSRYPGRR